MEKPSENVKKKKSNYIHILWLLVLFVSVSIPSFQWYKTHNELQNKQLVVKEINNEVTQKDGKIQELEEEIAKINERMEGIKTNEDLLKRDIFQYIDRKFQIIPKTVSHEIAEQVIKISKAEQIAPELIIGVMQVESEFNPMAISKKNARGLMQVMPEWAPKFGLKKVTDLHDIDTNIKCGVKVLKIHIEEGQGSISKGLYYYVGKSDEYAGKVFAAMGKFVAFRSTMNNDKTDIDITTSGGEYTQKEVTANANGGTVKR
jgi:hypothetical protein